MGRLATTRMFAGVWLGEVSGPRVKFSLESESWRRETYMKYRRCKLMYKPT